MRFKQWKEKSLPVGSGGADLSPLITRFLSGMLQAGRKMKFYDILNHSNEILFVCFCALSFGPSGKCVDRE